MFKNIRPNVQNEDVRYEKRTFGHLPQQLKQRYELKRRHIVKYQIIYVLMSNTHTLKTETETETDLFRTFL